MELEPVTILPELYLLSLGKAGGSDRLDAMPTRAAPGLEQPRRQAQRDMQTRQAHEAMIHAKSPPTNSQLDVPEDR
jgi:hypothetical protein